MRPASARALGGFLLDTSLLASACAEASLAHGDLERMESCVRATLDLADTAALAGQRLHGVHGGQWEEHADLLARVAESARRCTEECERLAAEFLFCRTCAAGARRCWSATSEILELLQS